MPLSAGTRLGPYEIVSFLSAGGMGEVYRARDTRLDRWVAIKILPPSFVSDPDRIRRFEREARAVAALNHPNILALHDIGLHDGTSYLVSELLEGTTLREQLTKGALSARKAMEYGLQIAQGLAAAHDKDIVHRDLKPENIFVTKDGRVKILDFGLATAPIQAATPDGTTLSQTKPGVVLGTVGYMSPEQVRGDHIDYRSDIFSCGAVLYEMFSGERAFQGDSGVEIMSAILCADPPELTRAFVHPALDRTIRRCLEKERIERFQSAHDLAFQLKIASDGVFSKGEAEIAERSLHPKRMLLVLAGLALVVALLTFLVLGLFIKTEPAAYKQLTFRTGSIGTARFSSDGRNVIYSAAWEGHPSEIFVGRADGSEARPLGIGPSELLSVSKNGELAVLLKPSFDYALGFGTLATVALEGGTPREIAENITSADWAPNGTGLAIVRDASRLEFPVGKVLFQSAGWLSHPRFSPDGKWIAFIDHPPGTASGSLVICDLNGVAKRLASDFSTNMVAGGVAWSRNGKEVWFSGVRGLGAVTISAVSRAGKERLAARTTVGMTIHDIASDGRVLFSGDEYRVGIKALAPHSGEERDLSWLDWSLMGAISPDGELVAFSESGEAVGGQGYVYLRDIRGTPAVRLGEGRPWAITPDKKWVIATAGEALPLAGQLVMLPTGVGEPRRLLVRRNLVSRPRPFPDGKRILFNERTADGKRQAYIMSLNTGEAKPVLPPDVVGTAISPDGKYVVGFAVADQTSRIYELSTGSSGPILGLKQAERVMAWGNPPLPLYVSFDEGASSLDLFRLDPTTGQRRLWRHLSPADPAGVRMVSDIYNGIAPTAQAYGYSYYRLLSQLSIAEGLR
jgi:eukaryotic-like serine/threonine-protein kinase